MMNRLAFSLFTFLFLTAVSCGPRKEVSRNPNGIEAKRTSRITTLLEPSGPISIQVGEQVKVRLQLPDSVAIDSVEVFLGGSLKNSIALSSGQPGSEVLEFLIGTENEKTGKSGLRLRIFFNGGMSENQSQQITFLSDIVPTEYSFKVVREYPHDPGAYTQGLQFVDGWIYEGTGNYGASSLRRVDLETGEVVKIRNLDATLFGEGITVFGERIYQLTYKSQVGFIYDKSSFEEIQKVYYQNKEGWGLTHNGKELIMSDGTNVIYFLDPEMFTVNGQLEVYDNEGPSQSLNELEYMLGKIWANRFYTDEIVIIDPETGKVEGRIDLKGILKATDRKTNTDVLNGIAWDQERDRIFVTGKRWPKMFEIELERVAR